jgi:hypothetical protein
MSRHVEFLKSGVHVGGRFERRSHLMEVNFASRWSKAKFKSPCNFEESPYVATRVFSALVIYENVDIVQVFIEIYHIH